MTRWRRVVGRCVERWRERRPSGVWDTACLIVVTVQCWWRGHPLDVRIEANRRVLGLVYVSCRCAWYHEWVR